MVGVDSRSPSPTRADKSMVKQVPPYGADAQSPDPDKREQMKSASEQETNLSWDSLRGSKESMAQPGKPGRLHWWQSHAKELKEDLVVDWWFASTAVPLLAATIAPLANVLSIAALVTYWRVDLEDGKGGLVPQLTGRTFPDPRWCYWSNVGSLICGFIGNMFLLFNFTGFVRYIISLPASIILFFAATGILTGLTISMHIYNPPLPGTQTWSQGFWYAIIASVLYCVCSLLLMVNMLGFWLGHYDKKFNLTDHQRTLILQTMLFFIWLAGGGAVFSRIEKNLPGDKNDWSFVDGIYFCDVTILTVGFGDLVPLDDLARGLVFPYSVGGIIMLGLVISSLHKFASDLGEDNVVKGHIEKVRSQTLERSTTNQNTADAHREVLRRHRRRLKVSRPYNPSVDRRRSSILDPELRQEPDETQDPAKASHSGFRKVQKLAHRVRSHTPKLILLREEKDRFEAMRLIQSRTRRFKRWSSLTVSITAFAVLWCVGAIVFWQCEKIEQGMSYFQALYFAYVSLLTIGYGDWAPKSNAGRAFFVVWSLIAVPTMTILISDMSSTVIESFKSATFSLADFTLLPQKGAWRNFIDRHPRLLAWIKDRKAKRELKKRKEAGIPFPQPSDLDDDDLENPADDHPPTLEALANEAEAEDRAPDMVDESKLACRLATAIRNVASDVSLPYERRYSYEEWVELTRLIRFTSREPGEAPAEDEDEGMVEWDWIGEDSPMMSGLSEPEFVLARLCESMKRYVLREQRKKTALLDRDRGLLQGAAEVDELPILADEKT